MGKVKFDLLKGEEVLLKNSCVRHGFWGAYVHDLVLTNMSVIWVKRGMFGNYKGNERFDINKTEQIVMGEAFNGEKQLEIYNVGEVEDFAFQSCENERMLKVWMLAIKDIKENRVYDSGYYQRLIDSLDEEFDDFDDEEACSDEVNFEFIKDVAAGIVKSGKYNIEGIAKAVKKAIGKNKRRDVLTVFMDELGITDLKDEFLEEFGFKKGANKEEKLKQKRHSRFDKKIEEAYRERVTTGDN